MKKRIVLIASDHAGYNLKQFIKASFSQQIHFIDLGANSRSSVDYPDYAYKLTSKIEENIADTGILICGSGIGISIAANRNKSARAALCHNELTAELARQHNDANILCLGERLINESSALKIVKRFLETEFEGGRHKKRVEKLSSY